ncbi:DNA-binding HxlR family transcriptional regulator [Erwinia persicina]|uniref:winged helix-turn-helix transcriptional regulator n=1 Tax=Erwinia TaxID=551 RepID=UPI00209EA3CF|nr:MULTISPECIES: helix-turn-helix domain-containing protein [Erwinia]MCP1438580.1 DNA-binding HxlR family transcriptional regulator [Erwinia persicina]MDN8542208.1 helix-turn-helix domain-containing protein [Erwinia sp. BC051422]
MEKNSSSIVSLRDRLQRGELLNRDCPSREVLKRLTGRWSLLVLIALENDTLRFGELRRKIGGVSERMLAQTLRFMEEDGFVERIAYEVIPPHVEYKLTVLGHEARDRITGLADWIEVNLHQIIDNRRQFSAEE